MRKILMLGIFVCLLYSAGYIFGSNNNTISQKKPAVLFIGSPGPYYIVARELNKEGFIINIGEGFPYSTPLTWDEVKNYNVIVLTGIGLGQSNADFSLTQTNKKNISVLMKFLSKGGGILFIPSMGEVKSQMPAQEAFGKKIGITPLFNEVVADNDTQENATAWNLSFGLTENIIQSPITKNVHSLWYPLLSEGNILETIPFLADKNWNIVVKGSRTSHTENISITAGAITGKKGSYSTDVPLVAYRKFGKGRVVYFSTTSDFIFLQTAETTFEGIVLSHGLEGKPSNGYQIFENSLKWLSESSMKGNIPGGATMNMSLLNNPFKVQFATPYNWNGKSVFPGTSHQYKGIIGAQTQYSSGHGTVKEWVSAAKKAGLSYIVFLENFAALTKAKFEQLKKECKKYTTSDFTAIPGFTIKDEVGDHYFYFGKNTLWPAKKYLSSDGKEFISYDPTVGGNPYQKGQLAMTTLNYAYTDAGFNQTAGNYLFSKSVAPFTDFFSDWDAMGVITSINNKEVENKTTGYLQVVDSGQDPLPVAIDIIDSPQMLSKTQWTTVIMPDNWPHQGAPQNISEYWDTWHFEGGFQANNIYITDGPKIENFSFVGYRDYPANDTGNFVWQDYRWEIHGKVDSKAGLKEVEIYDGTKLFRRFLVGGKKQFQFNLDITHDRQHVLVLVATDINGGKAISRGLYDRGRFYEFMCGDRNNQFDWGHLTRTDGTYIQIGGAQTATPFKRVDTAGGITPSEDFFSDPRLGAAAFDGSPGGDPDLQLPVSCNSEKGQISAPNVSDSIRLFDSGDVNIGEGILKWNFADKINVYNVWHTLWKTKPAKEFTLTRTNYLFNVDPNSPIIVYLINIHIKLLKNIPNNGFSIGFIDPVKSHIWTIRSGNKFYEGIWKRNNNSEPRAINEPFNKGSYVASLDSPLGSLTVYPLTNGLEVETWLPGENRIYFTLSKKYSPQEKGQIKNIKILLIGFPRTTSITSNLPSTTNEVPEKFYHEFGLSANGKTAYHLNIKTGRLISKRYILNINGGKYRCFSGSITGNLISTLPIVVSNLENRNSVYLYDRGLKKARPIGVYNGKAYSVITLHGTRNLFIGEPVICDAPDLFVQVTQTGENRWHIGINNPTDRVIKAHIMLNPYFEPFKGKTIKGEITINPGTSIYKTI